MQTNLIAADPGQSAGWLIATIIFWLRDYGWMMALAGFATVWLLRRARHQVTAAAMAALFTVCSLVLPASIVLNFVTFATPPKTNPTTPTEVRKSLTN